VLLVFEKPGPMTASGMARHKTGSGFISRDNDDATAEATFRIMRKIHFARERTISWNVIPWWNGTRRVTAAELRDGTACVPRLIRLLPRLRAIIFVGSKAKSVMPRLAPLALRCFESAHPSPIVRATRPELWQAIPEAWRRARNFLDRGERPAA
jgi:G:T/U-mismatch repair DNA glycosylase